MRDPFLVSAAVALSVSLLCVGATFHAIHTDQDATALIYASLILAIGTQIFVRLVVRRSK